MESRKSEQIDKELEEAIKNLETVRELIKIVNRIMFDAPYMDETPNDNTDYQMALAEQVLNAANLSLMLIEDETAMTMQETTKKAMLLRSLIEVTANIYHFSINKDDLELARRFLKTQHSTNDALMKIYKKEPVVRYKWININIFDRITKMEKVSKSKYSDLYYYLSSFVHSDAGVSGSYIHTKNHRLNRLFLAWTFFALIDMMGFLEKAGVLEDNSFIKFANQTSEYLKEKKSSEG